MCKRHFIHVKSATVGIRVQMSALAAAIILGGCSAGSNSRVAESDSPVWGRADCQRGQGNPELQQQFEDAKATCSARGDSADALAGKTGASRCMTEQGYVLRTKTEHAIACQAVGQAAGTAPTQTERDGRPVVPPQRPAGTTKQ